MRSSSLRSSVIASAALVVLMLLASLVRHRAALEADRADSYEASFHAPPGAWLVVMTLGYREATADLFWCRALVYQGEEFGHHGSLAHVFRYASAIEALDPDFRALYGWVGTAGVYRPQGVTAEQVWEAVAFLERGRDRFPEDGNLAWVLGATLAFELPPLLPEAERENARLAGLEHLMDAVRMGAAPEWVVLSNTSMLASLGRAERAAEHLEEMYATVSDERVRAEIAERIAEIRSDAYGQGFSEASDELEYQRVRRYPYVPPSLYFLIAPDRDETDPVGDYAGGLIESLSIADRFDGSEL